jgi:hypothetical protein
MSHALATVLHRGRKAASNIMSACLASSREALLEMARVGRGTVLLEQIQPRRVWLSHQDVPGNEELQDRVGPHGRAVNDPPTASVGCRLIEP